MSIPRAVQVKVMGSLGTVWEVRVYHAYPIRQQLSSLGLTYHPGHKAWRVYTEPAKVQGILRDVLGVCLCGRLNISALSSPIVRQLMKDAQPYFENMGGEWVLQTSAENLDVFQETDIEDWMVTFTMSMVGDLYEWLEVKQVDGEIDRVKMLTELQQKPRVFEDFLLRVTLSLALRSPGPAQTPELAREEEGIRKLFGLYRRAFADLSNLSPERLRQTYSSVRERDEGQWTYLLLVYPKLRALGLLDDELQESGSPTAHA